jgi:phosphoribosyl-AMP cyclohydrolase / phosphoribosyl-ATP pyrophosphohydrolase
MRIRTARDAARLDFAKGGGLLPVVAQDARTGAVLMLAYATPEAVERTLETGDMWYFSRSRDELWRKGATSGNVQRLVELHADCDSDALLALVLQSGPSCHTGEATCFDGLPVLPALARTIEARVQGSGSDGAGYTQRLLSDENLRLKKLGEEAVELALACTAADAPRAAEEAADLTYHLLVAAAAAGVSAADVLEVLRQRRSPVPAHDDEAINE